MKNANDRLIPLTMDKEKELLGIYMKSVEKNRSYSEFPSLDENPFLCEIVEDVSTSWIPTVIEKEQVVQHPGKTNGEMITLKGGVIFKRNYYVDKGKFNKLYLNNLKDMFRLSATALKLFGYFIGELDFKERPTMVYMNLQDAMIFCDWDSRAMVYRGLTELLQKGFVCKNNRGQWWFFVNPKYAFNGDRAQFITEYITRDIDGNEQSMFIVDDYKVGIDPIDDLPKLEIVNDFE